MSFRVDRLQGLSRTKVAGPFDTQAAADATAQTLAAGDIPGTRYETVNETPSSGAQVAVDAYDPLTSTTTATVNVAIPVDPVPPE